MKHTPAPQSATSLGESPRHDADTRVRQYVITMGVRVVCIVLMVLVVPYSWYTWIFAAGAIFLPYIAVVIANVGPDGKTVAAVSPDRQLTSLPVAPTAVDTDRDVIRIEESRPVERGRGEDSAA